MAMLPEPDRTPSELTETLPYCQVSPISMEHQTGLTAQGKKPLHSYLRTSLVSGQTKKVLFRGDLAV